MKNIIASEEPFPEGQSKLDCSPRDCPYEREPYKTQNGGVIKLRGHGYSSDPPFEMYHLCFDCLGIPFFATDNN